MKNSKKTRDFLIRSGLYLFNIIISLLIIETVLRVGFRDKIVLFPRYHTDAHYGEFTIRRIRSNAVYWHTSIDGSWKFTTNEQGFRNYQDFDYAKPEGVIRIASLGDSHTQGFEVRQEYTYSAIIEKYLSREGYRVEVMNTGVSGFGTSEELVLLENEMVKYQPDFVVLGFSSNDFEDNIRSDIFKLDKENNLIVKNIEYIPGVKIQNFIYSLPFIPWLSENSYAYSMLFNGVWGFYKNISSKDAQDRVTEYAVSMQDDIPDFQVLYTSKLVERMYQFCQDHQIKLIIVYIPTRIGENGYQSTFPPTMISIIENNSDANINSAELLSDYAGVAGIFVPHGDRHISEFTHILLGVAISKRIETLLK